MTDVLVTMQHVRTAGICSRGAREWFASHGLSWQDFVDHGLTATQLRATGDALAEHAIVHAEAEAKHGR
jgi:hypothetical protein